LGFGFGLAAFAAADFFFVADFGATVPGATGGF
jgi:hypothetical protein